MDRNIRAKEIGKRLRELRGVKTRTGVARELGISYSALCKYEDGLKIPGDDTKVRLADYYQRTVQEIFFA